MRSGMPGEICDVPREVREICCVLGVERRKTEGTGTEPEDTGYARRTAEKPYKEGGAAAAMAGEMIFPAVIFLRLFEIDVLRRFERL